ncbi:PREDICTED: aurora kinase A and ninein-interacting protein [Fulmarus glacialis]|uniref:aurora kinase A and ninein-interacting protein n=1 Tax=Fulmarus glacialis TaxID=30455 RepID=UPI00051BB381|nr:PREDICTED: aurora kinase A and ninein-interacting protein [Fulmarus glacialis]
MGPFQPQPFCDGVTGRAEAFNEAKPKVSSRILERKHASVAFAQSRASRPRAKQTTISAFFSAQTGEKDKENSRPSPFSPNKDCEEKGISLAASPVKILALPQMEAAQKQSFRAEEETVQVTPQRRAQKAPPLPTPLPDSLLPPAESHSRSEASCGAGEDCCIFSFTQDSEGNRIIAHRNESDVFAGETVSASGSVRSDCGRNEQEGQPLPGEVKTGLDFQPKLGANQNKKPYQSSSDNSLIDFSETENINPTITRDSTWAAGFYSSPQRPAGARPLRERSQNAAAGAAEEGWGSKTGLSSPCRQLFTQDSEGNRVIAHRCQNILSPRKDSGSSRRQLPNSPYKGCSSHAANRSLSKTGEQWLDVCYDLLFTQDSEGNRVMKH